MKQQVVSREKNDVLYHGWPQPSESDWWRREQPSELDSVQPAPPRKARDPRMPQVAAYVASYLWPRAGADALPAILWIERCRTALELDKSLEALSADLSTLLSPDDLQVMHSMIKYLLRDRERAAAV